VCSSSEDSSAFSDDESSVPSSGLSDDQGPDANLEQEKIKKCQLKIHRLEMRLQRLKRTLEKKTEELKLEKNKTSSMEKEIQTLKRIKQDEADGKPQAAFFMDQMRNYYRKAQGYRWCQTTIKHSIHFQAKSPGTYESIRKSNLLLLPCRRTLQGYVGGREGEVGFIV